MESTEANQNKKKKNKTGLYRTDLKHEDRLVLIFSPPL